MKTAKKYLFGVFLFIVKIYFYSFLYTVGIQNIFFLFFYFLSILYVLCWNIFSNFFFITTLKTSFISLRYGCIHLLKMEWGRLCVILVFTWHWFSFYSSYPIYSSHSKTNARLWTCKSKHTPHWFSTEWRKQEYKKINFWSQEVEVQNIVIWGFAGAWNNSHSYLFIYLKFRNSYRGKWCGKLSSAGVMELNGEAIYMRESVCYFLEH